VQFFREEPAAETLCLLSA